MYQRYNTTPQNHNHMAQKPSGNTPENRSAAIPKPQHPQNNKPAQHAPETLNPKSEKKEPARDSHKPKSRDKTPYTPLLGLIPRHIYNPDTKKILGVLSSEDLLLIALIFLFLESNDDDNPLMVLALVYVLLGEYIDFGEFAF